MARQKQAAPLRREPSDFENMNGHSSSSDYKMANGKIANGVVSAVSEAAREPPATESQKQAGLTQLVICIAGIYATL